MVQPIGNLIINMRLNGQEFSKDLGRTSARTASESQRMRRSIDGATHSIERLRQAGHRRIIGPSFIAATRNFDSLSRRAEFLRATMVSLTAVFGGLSTALVTNAVSAMADGYTNLNNQLKTVTKSEQERLLVEEALYQISQDTRTGLRDNAVLFTRITRATDRFNLSLERRLNLTRTLQKGFISGGATAQEASSAAIQLTQGLAADQLGGEELRALKETPLGAFLAEGLGVAVGDLKEMGAQGELTAERIVAAFEKVAPKIDDLFSRTQISIGQSLTRLDNAFLLYIGSQDKSLGTTQMLAKGLSALADNVDTVANSIIALTAAFGTRWVGATIGRSVEKTSRSFGDYNRVLRDNVVQARSSQAAAQGLYAAAVKNRDAALSNAKAFSQGQKDATGYKNAMTALHRSNIELSSASKGVAASTAQLNRALAVTTVRARAAGAASRALSGTMSFFGGPIGLAITAVSLGLLYTAQNSARAAQRGQEYVDVLSDQQRESLGLSTKLEKLSDNYLKTASAAAKLAETEKARAAGNDAKRYMEELISTAFELQMVTDGFSFMDLFGDLDNENQKKIQELTRRFLDGEMKAQDFAEAISEIAIEVRDITAYASSINQLVGQLQGAETVAANVAARIRGVNEAMKEVGRTDEVLKGLQDIKAGMAGLNQELENSKLSSTESDIVRETERLADEFNVGKDIARLFAEEIVRNKEAVKESEKAANKAAKSYGKMSDKLEGLQQRSAVAFLEDLDREAVSTAQSMKVAAADIQAFIDAVRSEDLASAPDTMLRIREALQSIETEDNARQLIEDTATGIEKLKEKHAELSAVVAKHPELAARATEAFVDYAATLDEFRWIDDFSTAFGDFAKSAIFDFNNLDDAAEGFARRIGEIALQILLVEPLIQSLRSSMGGLLGGGLGGGGIGSIFASIFHEGGDGSRPKRRRAVPISTFNNAPRFHDGTRHGELAAIIEDTESVLTQDQMQGTIDHIRGLANAAGFETMAKILVELSPGLLAAVREQNRADAVEIVEANNKKIPEMSRQSVAKANKLSTNRLFR
ncbi:MAG: tape measure protein [Roseibium sp.]|nr:tape measure protein [Roseibium sp.]